MPDKTMYSWRALKSQLAALRRIKKQTGMSLDFQITEALRVWIESKGAKEKKQK